MQENMLHRRHYGRRQDSMMEIFFRVEGDKIVMSQYLGRTVTHSTLVNFYGIGSYMISKSNLYNGIIQTVLKSENIKVLGFIDITQRTNPTLAIPIGTWNLSDILLRDDETVIAAKVDEDNNILFSHISVNHPRLKWELIPYISDGNIESIEINGDYIQGFDNGNFFKIPLLVNEKPIALKLSQEEQQLTNTNPITGVDYTVCWGFIHYLFVATIIVSSLTFCSFICVIIYFIRARDRLFYAIEKQKSQDFHLPQRSNIQNVPLIQRQEFTEEVQKALNFYRQHNGIKLAPSSNGFGNTSSWERDLENGQKNQGRQLPLEINEKKRDQLFFPEVNGKKQVDQSLMASMNEKNTFYERNPNTFGESVCEILS
ncbi:hypothetical protein FO519_010061 [Halicephalobus sp. NKZ332]|nr:hypothetical protein FO519_010061 [Halicephalobus sp. NKZ332]